MTFEEFKEECRKNLHIDRPAFPMKDVNFCIDDNIPWITECYDLAKKEVEETGDTGYWKGRILTCGASLAMLI